MRKYIFYIGLITLLFLQSLNGSIFKFTYSLLDSYTGIKLKISNIYSETLDTIYEYNLTSRTGTIDWNSDKYSNGVYNYEVWVKKDGGSWIYKKEGSFKIIK